VVVAYAVLVESVDVGFCVLGGRAVVGGDGDVVVDGVCFVIVVGDGELYCVGVCCCVCFGWVGGCRRVVVVEVLVMGCDGVVGVAGSVGEGCG